MNRKKPPVVVDHPALGELTRFPHPPIFDTGWYLTVSLPAFRSCYERWFDDGRERPDTRDDDAKAARFQVRIPYPPADGPGIHEPPRPSAAQVAAVEYLKANQARVAENLIAALVEQAPSRFHWEDITRDLADVTLERLAAPAGMLQMVELQGLGLGVLDHGGIVKVGFAFHSEILETEHGVGVVMLGDVAVLVGAAVELLDMDRPDEDDLRG